MQGGFLPSSLAGFHCAGTARSAHAVQQLGPTLLDANLGALLGFFLGGDLTWGLHPSFFLIALGSRAGCGMCCVLCAHQRAPIGGQKVSGPGPPGAWRGVKGKLGGSGSY